VDGRRFNSRVVGCRVGTVARLVVGTQLDVVLRKGNISVTTRGVVKKHDPETGLVTVEVEPNRAILTGKLNSTGQLEVQA